MPRRDKRRSGQGEAPRIEESFRNWSALPDEDITTWRKRWDKKIEERLARPETEIVEGIRAAAEEAAANAAQAVAQTVEQL